MGNGGNRGRRGWDWIGKEWGVVLEKRGLFGRLEEKEK
jgi:hypothetical protein